MKIESMMHGGPPPWPTEGNWLDIVKTQDELVETGKFKAEVISSASWSITLAMVCAVMGKAIPMKYRLKTRNMGIGDHPTYVKDYAEAVCSGVPASGIGKVVKKPLGIFANDLGLPVQVICQGLLKAVKTGEIDRINSSSNTSPDKSLSSVPTKKDIELAELQLRNTSTDEVIGLDAVLDQVKEDFEKAGKPLKENWRNITKQEIPKWFSKQ